MPTMSGSRPPAVHDVREHLALPFETKVLGTAVTVASIDLRDGASKAYFCHRSRPMPGDGTAVPSTFVSEWKREVAPRTS